MIFRVSDALAEIAPFVEGGGVDVHCDPGRGKALNALNRAVRQLMNEGDWHGMVLSACLPVRDGVVTLDERFETVRAVKWRCGPPIPIHGDGFKYLEGGMDAMESCISAMVDLGDASPVHCPLRKPMAVLAYSDREESENAMLEIRGVDANTKEHLQPIPIRHSWKGSQPPAYTGPDCEFWSTGVWSRLTELRKPVTRGLVHVFGYDPDKQETCWLTTMRPETVSPNHRRYYVPAMRGCARDGQVIARLNLRWHPVAFDTDVLPVQNIDAIARMVQAHHRLDTADMGGYQSYKNSALSQLRKQVQSREYGARKGLNVNVRRAGSRIRGGYRRIGSMPWTDDIARRGPCCADGGTRTVSADELGVSSAPFTAEWHAEVEARLAELETATAS